MGVAGMMAAGIALPYISFAGQPSRFKEAMIPERVAMTRDVSAQATARIESLANGSKMGFRTALLWYLH